MGYSNIELTRLGCHKCLTGSVSFVSSSEGNINNMDIVFCYGKNPTFTPIALTAGYRYGAQLPCTTYAPVWFADQNWLKPDRAAYMAALAQHRPTMASVIDWEREDQIDDVLSWAEEAAQHVERVMIIPKVSGQIGRIPRRIGGRDVVLGYSVPTSHGGTDLMLWEFSGWPVHLLGGSPQRQMRLARDWFHGAVVSVDGNMHCLEAGKGRFWSAETNRKGHWWQLRDVRDERTKGVYLECFRRSCENIIAAWRR